MFISLYFLTSSQQPNLNRELFSKFKLRKGKVLLYIYKYLFVFWHQFHMIIVSHHGGRVTLLIQMNS